MNSLAKNSVEDLAFSVLLLIQSKLAIGHQLNIMESRHALSLKATFDNWVDIYTIWRPIALSNILAVDGLIYYSGIMWNKKHLFALNTMLNLMVFINFNNTVCNDTVHFPGSNCSVFGAEIYPFYSQTFQPDFQHPLYVNEPVNVSNLADWKSGAIGRTRNGWHSTPQDPFSIGYSDVLIMNSPIGEPSLFVECNAAILDFQGQCVGQMSKSILLSFLGQYLSEITTSNKLLNETNGRVFSFQRNNGYLTGASHGEVYRDTAKILNRVAVSESSDPLIAEAGHYILPLLKGNNAHAFQFNFAMQNQDFICGSEPLTDKYGLAWMVAVVLSLTDLFYDLNRATLRMLAITASAIAILSISAGPLISIAVTRPLVRLSGEMQRVAEMDLGHIHVAKGRCTFYELALMQGYFHKMIQNLQEFRTFLPDAILRSGSDEEDATPKLAFRPAGQSQAELHSDGALGLESENIFPRKLTRTLSTPRNKVVPIETTQSHGSSNEHSSTPTHGTSTPNLLHRKSIVRQIGNLTRRTVSVLNLDFKSFHQIMHNEALLLETHGYIMQKIQEILYPSGATCSPILGDKLIAFWNVRNIRSDHAIACVSTAKDIHETARLQTIAASSDEPSSTAVADGHGSCPLRLACSMEVAVFGTMGTNTNRAFTVVSPSISRGALLQKLGKLLPLGVLCDGLIHERVQYQVRCRLVAFTQVATNVIENDDRLSHVRLEHRVYEILGVKVNLPTSGEWMYDLQNQELNEVDEISSVAAIEALYDPNIPLTNVRARLEALSAQSRNAGTSDLLIRFYLDHMEAVRQMVHSSWGLMIPTSLFLCSTVTVDQGDGIPERSRRAVASSNLCACCEFSLLFW